MPPTTDRTAANATPVLMSLALLAVISCFCPTSVVGRLQQSLPIVMTVTGWLANAKAKLKMLQIRAWRGGCAGFRRSGRIRNGSSTSHVPLGHYHHHCVSLTRTRWMAFGCWPRGGCSSQVVYLGASWSELYPFPHLKKRGKATGLSESEWLEGKRLRLAWNLQHMAELERRNSTTISVFGNRTVANFVVACPHNTTVGHCRWNKMDFIKVQ